MEINLFKALPIDWYETIDYMMGRYVPSNKTDCHGTADVLMCDLYAAGCPVVYRRYGNQTQSPRGRGENRRARPGHHSWVELDYRWARDHWAGEEKLPPADPTGLLVLDGSRLDDSGRGARIDSTINEFAPMGHMWTDDEEALGVEGRLTWMTFFAGTKALSWVDLKKLERKRRKSIRRMEKAAL
jgi:hypothetical protein